LGLAVREALNGAPQVFLFPIYMGERLFMNAFYKVF
jgi:hypothetical protein